MSCSCIVMRLVMGMLYVFVRIFEGSGTGIVFTYAIIIVVVGVIWLGVIMGMLYDFGLFFDIWLKIYKALKYICRGSLNIVANFQF